MTDVRGNVAFVNFGFDGPSVVSKRELAKRWRCSTKTIDRRVADGLPSHMDGHWRMFDVKAADAWLDAFKAKQAAARTERDQACRDDVISRKAESVTDSELPDASERALAPSPEPGPLLPPAA